MSRGDTARRLLACGLAVAAIGCLFAGLRAGGHETAAAADPAAAGDATGAPTPVWSARRVPQPFVDAVGAVNLQTGVDDLVAGTDSCVRVDAAGLGTVARTGETRPVVPASTQKVLTAAGALGVLGPDATFTTAAVGAGPPAGGTLDRMWLVGGGDPVLSTPDWTAQRADDFEYAGLTDSFTPLTKLADAIVATGVRAIPGGIVGDGSRYATSPFLPVWPEADRDEVGTLGALVVDDGFDLATGTLVPDPALAAAGALSAMLVARGVAVGAPSTGTAPAAAAEIASIRSVPLSGLVTEMLSASDNSTAESLALEVGRQTSDTGTTAAGLAGITATLSAAGVDLTGVALVDASGLSSQDRLTCNALVETLALAARPRFRPVVDGLAIAAERGTLADRFAGTPIQGRLWAKTGTLTGSAGLAGDFDVDGGTGSPRFASVFNGAFSRAAGYALTDRIAEVVDAYPQSPPAAELVPAP